MAIKGHDEGLLPAHLGISSNTSVESTMPKPDTKPAEGIGTETEKMQNPDPWKGRLEAEASPGVTQAFKGF
jgi:hypothetical protein